MHLVATRAHTVAVAGQSIEFAAGESIHTESSYKHTVDGFLSIALSSGWASQSVWQDEARMFSLHLLTALELTS